METAGVGDEPIVITFKEGISLDHAEQAVARLGAADAATRPVRLDFRACAHVDVGAGWRIGNALRPHAARGAVSALVPLVTSPKDFQGRWFQAFTRSGLGYTLAAHASSVISNDADITPLLRAYYRETPTEHWRNFVLLPKLTDEGSINVDDFSAFLDRFRRLLRQVNVDVGATEAGTIRTLTKLCFEAVQNVRDHAHRAPLPAGTTVTSCLAMSYYKVLSRAAMDQGGFAAYVDRTAAHHGGLDKTGFVEVIVSDDGVGIAARQGQDLDIHRREVAEERAAFATALQAAGSVKLTVNDSTIRGDPGYGYTYIIDALRTLRAFGVLRTGRLLAIFDGTSDLPGFDLLPQTFGYLPGTVLDVVFPRPSSQLRLPI